MDAPGRIVTGQITVPTIAGTRMNVNLGFVPDYVRAVHRNAANREVVTVEYFGLGVTYPELARSGNFDVETTVPCEYTIAGTKYNLAAGKVCDTGTTVTIAAGLFRAMLVSVDTAGVLTGTWDGNDRASAALAKANLPAIPANSAALGYVVVGAPAAAGWTAGTDALLGGTGGNVATTTLYYPYSVDKATVLITDSSAFGELTGYLRPGHGAIGAWRPGSRPGTEITDDYPTPGDSTSGPKTLDIARAEGFFIVYIQWDLGEATTDLAKDDIIDFVAMQVDEAGKAITATDA